MSATHNENNANTSPRKAGAQSGQAIVLIALAMVGLIGFTGLALDGGSLLFLQRKAQTVAEMVALGSAVEQCTKSAPNIETVLKDILAANEIGPDDPRVRIVIDGSLVAGTGNGDYALITLNTNVPGHPDSIEVIVQVQKQPYFIQLVYNEEMWAQGRSVITCTNASTTDGEYILYATSPVCHGPESLHVSLANAYFDGSFWSNNGVSVTTGGVEITGTINYRIPPVNVSNNNGVLGIAHAKVAGYPVFPHPDNMNGWHQYANLNNSPPMPDLNIADFRPDGAIALAAGSNYHVLKPANGTPYLYSGPGVNPANGTHWYNFSTDAWNSANLIPREGIIYVPGDFGASGGNLTSTGAGLTIVAEGAINMSGVTMRIESYTSNVALWSNKYAPAQGTFSTSTAHCTEDVIVLGSVGTTWRGLIYAPGGRVNIPMSSATSFYGAIVANTINVSVSSANLYYHGSNLQQSAPSIYFVE